MQSNYQFTSLSYNTSIEFDASDINSFLKSFIYKEDSYLIIDKKVYELYFRDLHLSANSFIYNATEKNKSDLYFQKIISFLHENNLKRNSTIYAIGGGITTDIAAFCASVFKRGVKLVMVPTTLLAIVDASIGGKTAINFQHVKNQIGSFYPASRIMINLGFLDTLSKYEYYNGLVECIKTLVIQHNYNKAKDLIRNIQINQLLIKEIIDIKMNICTQDMDDKADRKYLNFGHSFAHVLESLSDNRLAHGEAVAYGMYLALQLSVRLKLISLDNADMYLKLFKDLISINPNYTLFSNIILSYPFRKKIRNDFINFLRQDKKNSDKISLILIDNDFNLISYDTDDEKSIKELVFENLL